MVATAEEAQSYTDEGFFVLESVVPVSDLEALRAPALPHLLDPA